MRSQTAIECSRLYASPPECPKIQQRTRLAVLDQNIMALRFTPGEFW
jgi:hypothetical protein